MQRLTRAHRIVYGTDRVALEDRANGFGAQSVTWCPDDMDAHEADTEDGLITAIGSVRVAQRERLVSLLETKYGAVDEKADEPGEPRRAFIHRVKKLGTTPVDARVID